MDRLLEDRRVGSEASNPRVADVNELAARDVSALQIVEPGALALVCVIAALSLGSLRGLDAGTSGTREFAGDKVAWSEEAVAELRSAGKPVFVDVTADWCITCMANETAVLLTDDMIQAFADHDVVYMVADWTNEDARIAGLLKKHGRNGIPLYLMYAADASTAPLVLPRYRGGGETSRP